MYLGISPKVFPAKLYGLGDSCLLSPNAHFLFCGGFYQLHVGICLTGFLSFWSLCSYTVCHCLPHLTMGLVSMGTPASNPYRLKWVVVMMWTFRNVLLLLWLCHLSVHYTSIWSNTTVTHLHYKCYISLLHCWNTRRAFSPTFPEFLIKIRSILLPVCYTRHLSWTPPTSSISLEREREREKMNMECCFNKTRVPINS